MKKINLLLLMLAASISFSSCSDKDEPDNAKLTQTSYTLYHDQTKEIEGKNIDKLNWTSSNEFVTTVEDGTLTGMYVGETTVKAGRKYSVKVTVKPHYTFFTEPSIDFGATREQIKSKYGTPYSENATSLVYETGNSNAPLMMFSFENGLMTGSSVALQLSLGTKVSDFLTERYMTIDVNTTSMLVTMVHASGTFDDPNIDYVVAMSLNSSNYILVMYLPYNQGKASGIEAADFAPEFKALESQFAAIER